MNRLVFTNLSRFKENLSKVSGNSTSKRSREYKVLLDSRSGEMSFAKEIRDLEFSLHSKRKPSSKEWKNVRLIVTDTNDGSAHFEIRDSQNRLIESPEVVKLTLDALNGEAKKVKRVVSQLLPEQLTVQNFFSKSRREDKEEIANLPGWTGGLTMDQVSDKLKGSEIGTYLIRESDEVVELMVDQIKEHYHSDISAYSLAILDEDEKISEVLILYIPNRGWIRYQDETRLDSPLYATYPSARALIQSMEEKAKFPFPFE